MIPLAPHLILVCGLFALVGMWLETIGGKNGALDFFFTPFPMSLSGMIIVALERSM